MPVVYAIENLASEGYYIGSTVNTLESRKAQHISDLRRGRHKNPQLQAAWNKYAPTHGESFLRFTALQRVRQGDVLEAEQAWIDEYRRRYGRRLYNACAVAGSPGSAKAKYYDGFVSPEGMEYREIYNLRAFCREHGLHASHMAALARGERDRVNGWTRLDTRLREYRIVAPDGTAYERITDLPAFCERHGLDPILIRKVIKGERLSHRGWHS